MKNLLLSLAVLTLVGSAYGATTAASATASTGQVTGSIDVRPSISAAGQDSFYTDNSIEAGYKFNDTFALSYLQGIITNLSNHRPGQPQVYADYGFLRFRANNLYVSADESVTLSYQGRLYAPTKSSARSIGFVTANRHYLTLSKKFSDNFTLYGSQVSVIYFYDRPGEAGAAHPVLENRFYLIGDVTLAKGLSLSLPLMFHQTRHRDYQAGAKNNNSWSLYLWTWPELTYATSPKTKVGVAYYSSNLLEEGGLDNGVGQLTFQAKL